MGIFSRKKPSRPPAPQFDIEAYNRALETEREFKQDVAREQEPVRLEALHGAVRSLRKRQEADIARRGMLKSGIFTRGLRERQELSRVGRQEIQGITGEDVQRVGEETAQKKAAVGKWLDALQSAYQEQMGQYKAARRERKRAGRLATTLSALALGGRFPIPGAIQAGAQAMQGVQLPGLGGIQGARPTDYWGQRTDPGSWQFWKPGEGKTYWTQYIRPYRPGS